MKAHGVIAFAAAAACHGLLLFGIRPGVVARPQPIGMTSQAVDVTLVDAVPAGESPVAAPAYGDPSGNEEPVSVTDPDQPAPSLASGLQPLPFAHTETNFPQPTSDPAAEIPMPTPEPARPIDQETAAPQPTPSAIAKDSRSSETASRGESVGHVGSHRHPATQGDHKRNSGTGSTLPISLPRYRNNPPPRYPEEARRNAQQGVVLVSAQVGADGRPSRVTIKRSSGFPLLDAAALDAVRKWTFDPARTGGLPTASHADVPVRFALENR